MPNFFRHKGTVSSSVINPNDESLLIKKLPKPVPTKDAITYFDETRDLSGFHKMMHDEPHINRRKEILEKHPEIKTLFTKDPITFFIVVAVGIFQLGMLFFLRDASWPVYLFCLFVISSTVNHTCATAVHDLTHLTAFENRYANQFAAILANIPQGLPSAMAFGRYHRDHHTYMNLIDLDPDLPTKFEQKLYSNRLFKMLFLIFVPFNYSLRPFIVMPKTPSFMEIVNLSAVAISNYYVYQYFGLSGLLYLCVGTLIGMGMNPCAGHIIAEHFEFVKGQETFSYYGPCNFFNLNVGYHTEHHDFPMIPWRNLPKLKKMAPEFYDTLPHQDSYLAVWKRFVLDETLGCWSRIDRREKDAKKQQ